MSRDLKLIDCTMDKCQALDVCSNALHGMVGDAFEPLMGAENAVLYKYKMPEYQGGEDVYYLFWQDENCDYVKQVKCDKMGES